jgi:DedD protein
MTQTDESTAPRTEPGDGDHVLRKRLLQRVAIAAALVLVLLGGLALFDSTAVRDEKSRHEIARIEQQVKPIEKSVVEEKAAEPADEPKTAEVATKEEPVAEPEKTEAPTVVSRAERPLTVPARAHQAMMRPAEPVAAPKPPEPAKEIARVAPPAHVVFQPAPASRPIARAAEAARHFLIQVGVFNNIANAEELRAKIEAGGVPARIEARVQVGPFASREEAEQAREKLKALGVEPGLVVAARK